MSLERDLSNLDGELKSFFARTDGQYERLQKQVDELHKNGADRHTSGAPSFNLEAKLRENDQYRKTDS
jgi:hypothetical protein